MPITYLVKDNDSLCSHCSCEHAPMSSPPQMDCPWCGCGWLFICSTCNKGFTFARGASLDTDWATLARKAMGDDASDADVAGWTKAVKGMLADVEVGKQYVIFDGAIIPTDSKWLHFEGWHARHDLDYLPHVAALEDPSVVESVLANADYWKSNALES